MMLHNFRRSEMIPTECIGNRMILGMITTKAPNAAAVRRTTKTIPLTNSSTDHTRRMLNQPARDPTSMTRKQTMVDDDKTPSISPIGEIWHFRNVTMWPIYRQFHISVLWIQIIQFSGFIMLRLRDGLVFSPASSLPPSDNQLQMTPAVLKVGGSS